MADFFRSIKNGVFKTKNTAKDDALVAKINHQYEQGDDSAGPRRYSPQRPLFRNKIGSMKRVIKTTHSSRQVMRQVSGLGMFDPVFGDEMQVANPQHPSFIFNDMDFAAIPEDMRDVLSHCSDHTADEKDGLDMEKFQQNLSTDEQHRPQAWQSCVTTLSSRNFGDSKQRELPCAQVIFGERKEKSERRSMPVTLTDLPELTTVSSQSTNPGTSLDNSSSSVRSKSPTNTRADPSNRDVVRSPRRMASYHRSPRKTKSYRQSPKKSSSRDQPSVSTADICCGFDHQPPLAPLDLSDGFVPTACVPKQTPSAPNRQMPNGRFKTPANSQSDGCRSMSPTKLRGADCCPKTPTKTQANECPSGTRTRTCQPGSQTHDCCSRTSTKAQQRECCSKSPPSRRVWHSPKKIASSKVPKRIEAPNQPPVLSDATFDSEQMTLSLLSIGNDSRSDQPKSASSIPSRSKSPSKSRRQLSCEELVRPSPRRASSRRNNSPKRTLTQCPHPPPTSNLMNCGEQQQQQLPLVPLDNGAWEPQTSSPIRIPVRVVVRPKSPRKVRSMSPQKKSRQNVKKTEGDYQPPPCLSAVN